MNQGIVIKSKSEVDRMRAAGKLNALALSAVHKLIQPGITTAELDAAAEEVIRSHRAIPIFKDYPGPYPYPLMPVAHQQDYLRRDQKGRMRPPALWESGLIRGKMLLSAL